MDLNNNHYIPTTQRLWDAVSSFPTILFPNGMEIDKFIELLQFYQAMVHAIHPEYSLDQHQYTVDYYCWTRVYPGPPTATTPEFPGTSPFANTLERATILTAEKRIVPEFGIPYHHNGPSPPQWFPAAAEGNPWVHLDWIVPIMEEVWYAQDTRRRAPRPAQNLPSLRAAAAGNKINAWVTLEDAVQTLPGVWNIDVDHIPIPENYPMPDFYMKFYEQGQQGLAKYYADIELDP